MFEPNLVALGRKTKCWLFSYGISIVSKRGGFGAPFQKFSKIQKTPPGIYQTRLPNMNMIRALVVGQNDEMLCYGQRLTDGQSDYITRSASQACKSWVSKNHHA